MNFNPQLVLLRQTGERAEAPDPVTAKPQARVTRVKTLAPAAVFASVSRVDNSPFIELTPREASTTFSLLTMQL
jgi:hypothetical protein